MPIQKRGSGERGLTTEDWIRVAKQVLIQDGIAGVKIERLAKKAGVTRGGFYYRFRSLQDLLDALIEHWRTTNHQPMIDALTIPGTPAERFRSLIRLWIEERDYDPDYDAAIRGWSRISPKAAAAVHRSDDSRIDALKHVFLDAGYGEDEAFIRARISYFHQVGYYAMGVRESSKRREELSELYYRVLTGFADGELRPLPPGHDAPDLRAKKTPSRRKA